MIDEKENWFLNNVRVIVLGTTITILYALLIFVYCHFFVTDIDSTRHNILFKDYKDDFFTSFRASFLEDLAFFLVLGLIVHLLTTLITYTSPDKHPFTSRVRALMNRKSLQNDDGVYMFLKSNLEKALGFYKIIEIDLTIEKFDSDHMCYKIFAKFDYLQANMCHDVDFKPQNEIYIEPDTDVNGDWGYVTNIGTYTAINRDPIDVKHDGMVHDLKNEIYYIDLNMNTPKNSDIRIKAYYGLWNKIDILHDPKNDYYLNSTRYVKSLTIKINNKITGITNIKCNIVHSDKSNKIKNKIANGAILEYDKPRAFPNTIEMYPSDKLRFYFYPPERK